MPPGSAVNRQWVIVLKDGSIVIDWGDEWYQDLISGEFHRSVDQAGSHTILDDELVWLKRSRNIFDFDSQCIYVGSLPERPQEPLD
jgi:hypothetical protein